MMKNTSEFENAAERALIACLGRVPFLVVEETVWESGDEGVASDFLVKVRQKESRQVIAVVVKKNGQPRIAREALNQVLRYLNRHPGAYGVFMAPYISAKAAEICRQDGVGYLDLGGNCRLCFDSVYIEQEGRPNVFGEKRDLRSLYSPKAERVLRVLLNSPNRAWKTVDLAGEARVSLGQVSNVKKLLLDREWVTVVKPGFRLIEPKQLLREWVENYSFRRNRVQDFYSLRTIAQIESDISEYCDRNDLKYCLTGFSGAARFAPSVRYNRAMAYVEEIEVNMATDLSLKEVGSGANVSLLTPYDDGIYYGSRDVNGARIVSPVQLYMDVIGLPGRGEEAAQALYEQVIRPTW